MFEKGQKQSGALTYDCSYSLILNLSKIKKNVLDVN